MRHIHIHFEETEPGVLRCADLPNMTIRLPRWWSLWSVYRVMNEDTVLARCLSLGEAQLTAFAFETMLDHFGSDVQYRVLAESQRGEG